MAKLFLALVLAVASSCTFAHVAMAPKRAPAPVVQLSPKMTALAEREATAPVWAFVVDTSLAFAGFAAGPVTRDERANLAGLAVTGLVFVSLAAAIAIWGHL